MFIESPRLKADSLYLQKQMLSSAPAHVLPAPTAGRTSPTQKKWNNKNSSMKSLMLSSDRLQLDSENALLKFAHLLIHWQC